MHQLGVMEARRRRGPSTIDSRTPIFVLRTASGGFQHGVLGVARSAGRLGIPVHPVRLMRGEPGLASRYVTGTVDLGKPRSEEEHLERVLAVGRALGRPLIVPVDDEAAVFVADHQDALAEEYRLHRQPPGLARRLASKRELTEMCRDVGIPAPAARYPADLQELQAFAQEQGFPVVLKRSEPWLPTHGTNAPSVCIAHDTEQLVAAYAVMESPERPQIMMQEYLPGGAHSVWMFNGYFDLNSRCLGSYTGRKLRQHRPDVGPTSLGICEHNAEVVHLAERLMSHAGYRGIVDMGFRFDQRDGSYKLLDVNPRLGGTFRLFVGDDGLDVLRLQYLDLTGQPVPVARPAPDGRKWLVEPTDLLSAGELIREGRLGVRPWARSLSGITETAWWATDDLRPFLVMCGRLLTRLAGRLRARRAGADAALRS